MKKLPSYLKGLVETRARSASDLERLEQLRARIDEEIAAVRTRLAAADTLIVEFNPLVDPTLIEPVRGRRPRVGKVREVIEELLVAAAPESLPTPEIAFLVAERIQIRFATVAEYRTWAYNCVNRALYKMWEAGKVDRMQTTGQATRWKLISSTGEPVASLADLRREANQTV